MNIKDFREKVFDSCYKGFPGGSDGKESACNVGDLGWEDPLEKRMTTGEFHGQRSLVSSIVPGVTKSWTRLSD